MPVLQLFKRKYYDEAQDELFSGEDMLPFVSFIFKEEVEIPNNVSVLTPKHSKKRALWKKLVYIFGKIL